MFHTQGEEEGSIHPAPELKGSHESVQDWHSQEDQWLNWQCPTVVFKVTNEDVDV